MLDLALELELVAGRVLEVLLDGDLSEEGSAVVDHLMDRLVVVVRAAADDQAGHGARNDLGARALAIVACLEGDGSGGGGVVSRCSGGFLVARVERWRNRLVACRESVP